MVDKSAGEASVKIVPDAKNFIRDLENDLRRRKAEFKVDVGANLSRATDDMRRFRAEQENRPVTVPVKVDDKAFKKALEKIKKDLGEAGSALGSALKVNLGAAAIGELPALATAITTVAASMQQLAGAGAVLPGVFAGIAADVGVTKLAVMGVGDAFKALDKASDGSAKNVKAANDALAKLAPQTAAFVKEVSGIKPIFDNLQKGVSGNFFDGLGASVKHVVDADLPLLQRGLDGIATSMNKNLKQLGTSLSSGSSQGFLDRILGNTGDAQGRLTAAIDPIIHALGALSAAGSDALPRLADGVGNLADRFDHFISAASDTGKLDKWINDGLDGFKHLGDTVLNIGKIFNDLTTAAGGGGGFLQLLDTGSQKLHDFLSSTQGQNTLSDFFAQGREDLKQLVPILENLGPIAQSAFQAAHDATQIWAPIIKEVTDVLASDPGYVKAIADAFLAWKFVGVITGVSDAVKGISLALGLIPAAAATAGTEAAAGLAPLTAALGPIAALFAAAGAFGAGIGPLTNASSDKYLANAEAAAAKDAADREKKYPSSPAVIGPQQSQAGPGIAPSGPITAVTPPTSVGDATAPNAGPFALPPSRQAGPGLPFPASPPTSARPPKDPKNPFAGYANGGDVVPAMLTPGEHVLTTGDVAALGGQRGVYAMRNALHMAAGGPVPLGNVTAPPWDKNAPGTAGGPRQRIMWWGGEDGVPHTPDNAGTIPNWDWGKKGPPNRNGTPWPNINGNFPRQGEPGYIEGRNRRGIGALGFAGGGAIPDYLAIANGQAPGGSAPGPTAPNPTQGGISNIASSFLSGLGGPLGQLSGFISGQIGGGTAGSGGQGLTPGLAGLAQAGSDPNKLNQWGQQTGDWLGKFGAKTLMSFGTTLYQGALGLVGLQNSALSPNNPYFQDATKLVDGILGNGSGAGGESSASDVSSLAAGSTSQSGVKVGSGATAGVKGAQRWRPTVEQALAQVGGKYGITNIPAWTNAILGQIQFESGGNPAALNPKDSDGLPAIGLGQFKAGTFAAHNITGGSINDPTAQIYAMIDYVSTRYGQNANGVPNGINRGHGYRSGGGVNGSGSGDTVPAMLTPGEHVLTTSDVKALGGQSGVYALREAIHMAAGGSVPSGVYVPPFPKIPDAQQLKPRPAPPPQQQRPSLPAAPVAPTAPSAPTGGAPDPTQPLQPSPFQGGFAPVAASDGTVKSHTLPAISKGITSGFATAGAIAQQAVALGAAAATGGASLAAGGGAGGGGGPSISGLFQQAGKIANDVADVASAFLVGNVTPGTTPNAYGETLRTAQNIPQTAPLNQSRNYVFNGIDGRNIVDSLQIKDAQDSQAALAGYRG